MRSDVVIGIRNLGRNRRRTWLAIIGITVAQATLIWVNSFMNGYTSVIFEKLTGPMLGHVQLHAPGFRDDNATERVLTDASQLRSKITQMPHVQTVSERIYGPVLAAAQEAGHAAVAIGLDLVAETKPNGLLTNMASADLPHAHEVIVGYGLLTQMRIQKGAQLALMGQGADGSIANGLYTVKGILKSDVELINRSGIIMSLAAAQDFLAMPNKIHEIAIRLNDASFVTKTVNALKTDALTAHMDVASWHELAPQIAAYLEISGTMTLIILLLVFLATSAGIANTMVMATFERKQEFCMLIALGCKPARLIRILLIESITIGFVGVVIGSIIGVAIVFSEMHYGIWILKVSGASGISLSMEGLDLSMDIFPVLRFVDVASGVAAVIATSVIATLWPARKISRLQPIEAMRV